MIGDHRTDQQKLDDAVLEKFDTYIYSEIL